MLISNAQINTALDQIADQLNNRNWGRVPYILCHLKGGVFVFADLIRKLTFNHEIGFIQDNINGYLPYSLRSIIIVDDIFETGNSCQNLINVCQLHPHIKDITYICLLKRKHCNRVIISKIPLTLMFGIEIESKKWLAGYGMDDYNGLNRNKNYIYELS